MVTLFQMIGASFVLVQLLMLILWLFCVQKRNAGIVDLGWGVGFILTMLSFFALGDGSLSKTLVLLIMVAVWGGRLTWFLFRRFDIDKEDPRYAHMRLKWGEEHSDFKFLILFVFQGVLITVLSLPFLLVSCCPEELWTGWEILGIFVWALGVLGEHFADEQKLKFKESGGQGICKIGLWRFSRHPNYFFDWVVWLGFAFYAFPAPFGILGFISPALMYYLLRYVSGVPLAESLHLEKQGDSYREYQNTTSEFFPWFQKGASKNKGDIKNDDGKKDLDHRKDGSEKMIRR